MLVDVMGFMNLLCAGLLAGVEFVIRYGVRAPLTTLDPQSEIQLRQTLIRRLRVVVPAIFGLAFLSGIGVTFREGRGTGFGFRCAGLLALVAFISITPGGTVPLNKAVLTWKATAPPDAWRAMIKRWERLDTVRTWAAVAAFGTFLMAGAPS